MRPPDILGGRIVFYMNFRCPFSAVRQAIVALGLQYFRCAAINAAPRQSSQASLDSALGLLFILKDVFSR